MTRLACNVYVLTEEGEAQLLVAGSTPPEWALPQLGEHTLQREESEPEGDEESDDDGQETVTIPPAKGPGSSAKAWADYAKSQGFTVLEDAKAAEIRESLAEAGIPVE